MYPKNRTKKQKKTREIGAVRAPISYVHLVVVADDGGDDVVNDPSFPNLVHRIIIAVIVVLLFLPLKIA